VTDEFVYRGHGQDDVVAALQRWVDERDPSLAGATIVSLAHPTHDGFSNITLLAEIDEPGAAGGDRREKVAIRLKNENASYDAMSLRHQYDDQIRLRDAGLPVPEMRWFGTDDEVLGDEFYAMAFAEGTIPSDLPSYHSEGWVTEMTTEQRRELWWNALDRIMQLHRLDPDAGGFSFSTPTDPAALIAAMLDERQRFVDRFAPPGSLGVVRDALRWLDEHRPAPSGPLRLCWGDARLPNMVFDGTRCVALLDWEDLHRGWPEFDLAWFIYMDRASAMQFGVERLDGLGDADETVSRWCDATGLPADELEWATVYGAVELTSGYAFAFSSFAAPDQVEDTLATIEQSAIFTDLASRIS
jgi:aminoglycoside phosphotransferase (APT) family kinase protein